MNNDTMNIEMKISTWVPAFSSSDYVPKSRIAGSYGNSVYFGPKYWIAVNYFICYSVIYSFLGLQGEKRILMVAWVSGGEHSGLVQKLFYKKSDLYQNFWNLYNL